VKAPKKRDELAIDEGLLLADRAARLVVRNRIEVETIGRGRDYDLEEFRGDAIVALEQLAAEQERIAQRLEAERRIASRRYGYSMSEHDYQRADRRNLRIRARIAERMAEELRAFAADPDRVADLVERARQEAWQDVADQMRLRMRMWESPPPEGDDPGREGRIADLAAELAARAGARSADLGE